ncbi:MAG: TetR/AcrR family transcriptional regulator [Pseudorhodoplanes sp.]|uniref:TetR/AcrR family transcriptional regulator n=1 Tax=Pseudorhodoplanes sp. TaxID=1934341 RepID=UPI003D115993
MARSTVRKAAPKRGDRETGPARVPTPHVKRKQDRRRSAIMDAAALVFAERGYFNATMKDIADRLGMRPASLYHYYPSKEAALEDMCRVSAVEFCERLQAILARGGPAVAMVRAGMLAHLTSERRAYVENFAFSRRNLPPGVLKELNALARAYRQLWKRIFVRGAERDEWRADLDPDVAADAVLALCNSAATTLPRRKNADQDAAMKWVELFLLGTRKR